MIGSRSFGVLQGGGSMIDVPVAALAGLSMAFLAFAAPADLLTDLIGSSGLPSILPAAEPPLGLRARIAIGAAGAVIVFSLAFILLRWLDRFGSRDPAPVRSRVVVQTDFVPSPPRLRRRDHHPDAPARAPLHATYELGEPALDAWPEPQPAPKREPELRVQPEPEPRCTPEPEPQWAPEPEPQRPFEPEPPAQSAARPAPVIEPEPQQSYEPEPPAQSTARPKPVIELESDPLENAWRLSRPYDPVLHEKQPSSQPWPQLDDEDVAGAGLEDEAEYEDEAEVEAEDTGLVGSPWPIHVAPEIEPQAAIADEPAAEAAPEPKEEALVREPTIRRAEPAPPLETESPAAFARPSLESSVATLLERLEQGMARRRTMPEQEAPDEATVAQAPVAQAPTAPRTPRSDPADDRLQSAIENLQRLAARRD